MLNSRDIDLLRPDVLTNCKIFLDMCKADGLNVLIVSTVRDQEYQDICYKNGTGSKFVTFHGVGLAFDICKNVKGHEYDDSEFFKACGKIGEEIGFEWGGQWNKADKPHFQWSGEAKSYTSSDILAGKLPPPMPLFCPLLHYKKIVQKKTGFSDSTMAFLSAYKFEEALFEKLAKAMQ